MPALARTPVSALLGALAVTLLAGCAGGDGPTTPAAGPTRLTVSPNGHTIAVGEAYAFTAAVTDGAGNAVPSGRVTWRSSTPDVATVDGAGVATGLAVGHTMIVALLDGAPRDSAALAVTSPASDPAPAPPPTPAPPTPDPTPPVTPAPVPPAPGPTPEPTPEPTPPPAPSPIPGPDARCGGVAQARTIDGSLAFRYSHSRMVDSVTYTFDDLAEMSFSLPRTDVGTHGVTWSGVVIGGHVRVSHTSVDASGGKPRKYTVIGEGQPERTFYGEDASSVSVSVDLLTCTYTLSASATVRATSEDVVGPVRVGSFVTRRIPLASTSYAATLPVHSALWVVTAGQHLGYFVGGPIVATMFLAGHGNDIHGEGGAAVDFSISPKR